MLFRADLRAGARFDAVLRAAVLPVPVFRAAPFFAGARFVDAALRGDLRADVDARFLVAADFEDAFFALPFPEDFFAAFLAGAFFAAVFDVVFLAVPLRAAVFLAVALRGELFFAAVFFAAVFFVADFLAEVFFAGALRVDVARFPDVPDAFFAADPPLAFFAALRLRAAAPVGFVLRVFPRPEPLFLPPLSCRLTVAHARCAAVSSDRPCSL